MSDFVDRAELLKRLKKSYTRLEQLLNRLTPGQTIQLRAVGDWSVKDVLAHLVAHEQRALQELRYALRGEQYQIDHGENDYFNAQAVTESRSFTFKDQFNSWKESYQQVVEAVNALSAADFEPTSRVVQLLEDSIDGALGNNTYEHYDAHADEIEAWLNQAK